MKRVLVAALGTMCLVGAFVGCSSDAGSDDGETPVGGINGPARVVEPDSGGAENNGGD